MSNTPIYDRLQEREDEPHVTEWLGIVESLELRIHQLETSKNEEIERLKSRLESETRYSISCDKHRESILEQDINWSHEFGVLEIEKNAWKSCAKRLFSVLPAFPERAKVLVGMEERYRAAVNFFYRVNEIESKMFVDFVE